MIFIEDERESYIIEVVLENRDDLSDARIFLASGNSGDFHALPLRVEEYPEALPEFAGRLIVKKLRNEYGQESPDVQLNQLWNQVVEQQNQITQDPA